MMGRVYVFVFSIPWTIFLILKGRFLILVTIEIFLDAFALNHEKCTWTWPLNIFNYFSVSLSF